MIALDPTKVLILVGGLILVVEMTAVVLAFPLVGLWMLMGASVINTLDAQARLSINSIQVSPIDVACTVLALTTIAQALRRSRWPSRWVLALLALALVALVRGIAAFGVQPAVNGSRLLAYFLVTLAFVDTIERHDIYQQIVRIWGAAAAFFGLLAIIFVARHGFGRASGARALNSQLALAVAQFGVLSLASHKRRSRSMAIACILLVVTSQQRTVWLASITSVAILVLRSSRTDDTERAQRLRRIVLLAAFAGVLLLTVGPASLRASVGQASDVSTKSGTLGWRVISGVELFQETARKPLWDQVVGQPFGAGFQRTISGQTATASPHNMYLAVLLSLGWFGFIALAVICIRAIKITQRDPAMWPNALLWGLVVYGLGYQWDPAQAMLWAAPLTVLAVGRTPAESAVVIRS